ncbi:hypothetical protein [Streptomyces sp. NBC_01497]|uniref:hypothetical protein n=1 Tax=Streptomyces sp. NBC_01497 TaxID=2903885 RepID=UPI002E3767D6|nr:hypothetical protein [Streptomyces sp. NBC_01497]
MALGRPAWNRDEQLLNGRIYGSEYDDPHPGPVPHRNYAELVGGPLDGLLLDVHEWHSENGQCDSRM